MKCPYCSSENISVLDTRNTEENTVKRRRKCENCLGKFNTFERISDMKLKVSKKNGSIENYNREKVKQGILRSLIKRDYDKEELEKILDNIEIEILTKHNKFIDSKDLGDLIMENLLRLDEVAYIRFASVYNQFNNVDSFVDIIDKIKEKG